MAKLEIQFEWIDPAGARGPALRATWARLQLTVDGKPIMRVYDQASKTVRDGVFLPVYPLAEWLATNWWFLRAEAETPGRTADNSYAERHDLRFASEGYALPSLMIRPVGEQVRVDWIPRALPRQALEFIGEGSAHVEYPQFFSELSDFISSVIGRLDELGETDTLLHQEWTAIVAADADEASFCLATASLGLDPYSIRPDLAEAVIATSQVLPAPLLEEFFATADYVTLEAQAEEVSEALKLGSLNQSELDGLLLLRDQLGGFWTQGRTPWEQGYQYARELRTRLGLNGQALASVEQLSHAFRTDPERLAAAVITRGDQRSPYDAVVAMNRVGSPGFVLSHVRAETQRFALCRGIYEFIASPPGVPALVTRARSERQQRNRAFAAEFLVPAESLRRRVLTETVSAEEVDDLSAEFGVSPYVIAHQLENHRIARTTNAT